MQFNTQFINMEQRNSQEKLNSHQQDQQPPPPPRRMKPPENQMAAQHQPPPPQKCPRCDSSNTKFCYYNNYSLSQPRYFCKACRRYWTHGGTLRNVPVGGGCRKTKRSKPSPSTSNEIARTQNFTGMVPGHGLRGLAPPVIPSIGNSFYTTGSFMSPLAAIQSLPAGINQGAAGSGGNGQFGANMALLQGMNLPSVRPYQQFQAQNDHFFRSQQNLMAQRPALNSWTQSFINRTTATTSAGSPTFWGGATVGNAADGENQTGSTSFNPSQWSDNNNNNPGFGPSQ